jgi:hypothetical protein
MAVKRKIMNFLDGFSFYSKKKRILVLGDSNSSRPNKKGCWPALVRKKLGGRVKIINDSSEGRTTMYDHGNRNGFLVLKKNSKPICRWILF